MKIYWKYHDCLNFIQKCLRNNGTEVYTTALFVYFESYTTLLILYRTIQNVSKFYKLYVKLFGKYRDCLNF